MGRGRPRKEISLINFKKLCGLQCTLAEIAAFFECSEDTIERFCKEELDLTFKKAFEQFSQVGKISLRRYQFVLAQKSAPMAIWLGKQYLGQKDVQVIEQSLDVKNPYAGLTEEELRRLADG